MLLYVFTAAALKSCVHVFDALMVSILLLNGPALEMVVSVIYARFVVSDIRVGDCTLVKIYLHLLLYLVKIVSFGY